MLEASALLPGIPLLYRREKEIENDIEAAINRLGACVYVLPVLPRRVTPGADFIFVEDGEVRVRVLENTVLNETGMDVYTLAERVALSLHGKNPGNLLADNLRLQPGTAFELVEDPEAAVMDLIFTAAFQLAP